MRQALAFFETLFGTVESGYLAISNLKSSTQYFDLSQNEALEKATEFALGLKGDVYFCTGVVKNNLSTLKGANESEICARTAFVLDIDFATGEHSKKKLPKDLEQAMQIVNATMPLRPAITVLSGGGAHLYYLFKEAWLLETEDERAKCKNTTRGFVKTFQAAFKRAGLELDSIFNLNRMLRVPETFNTKRTPAIKVSASPVDWALSIMPEDAEPFIKEEDVDRVRSAVYKSLDVNLTEYGSPPTIKLQALLMVNENFKRNWINLKGLHKSPSEYDLAMCNIAANAGWTDQEMADLINEWRRLNFATDPKQLEKRLRLDYVSQTICRAKDVKIGMRMSAPTPPAREEGQAAATADPQQGEEPAGSHQPAPEAEAPSGGVGPKPGRPPKEKDPEARAKRDKKKAERERIKTIEMMAQDEKHKEMAMADISELLQLEIKEIRAFIGDNIIYEIDTDKGLIKAGDIDKLSSYAHMKRRMSEVCRESKNCVHKDNWEYVVGAMLALSIRIVVGEGMSERDVLKDELYRYAASDLLLCSNKDDAYKTKSPYTEEEEIYFFPTEFKSYLMRKGYKLDTDRIGKLLVEIGCETKKINVRTGEKYTSTRVYKVPKRLGEE